MQEAPFSTASTLIDQIACALEPKVVAWRRHIHEHPELSFQEKKTSDLVAQHLHTLGFEVRRGKAHYGVVGILHGSRPGPVVALRADMDALPMVEETGLPFASKVRATFDDKEEGVMHACGHDAHTAILMGVAEVLASLKEELSGSVKFLFQPAEEFASDERESGASLMIREKALEDPRPDAIFGLHVCMEETGTVYYTPKETLAGGCKFTIKVRGKQTHAAQPWKGVDTVVVAAQIVLGLQTIMSRQINILDRPAILSIGSIHGGNRSNIIPHEVILVGTIRTFSEASRKEICQRLTQTAISIAESADATAEVSIASGCPVTYNDPLLVDQMLPTLQHVAGSERVCLTPRSTGSEDFSFYSQQVPGFFFFLGAAPQNIPLQQAPPHHSPQFTIDEDALLVGVRLLSHMTINYLNSR